MSLSLDGYVTPALVIIHRNPLLEQSNLDDALFALSPLESI